MKLAVLSIVAGLFLPMWAAEFSVFLAPEADADPSKGLAVRGDLHLDVGGRAVPLRLKAARQSIAYPCRDGGRIELFRVAEDDGVEVRETAVSFSVPEGAAKGVVILVPRGKGYRARPMWWGRGELRNGRALFVNLTERELQLRMGAATGRLLPGKQQGFDADFARGEEVVARRIEVYGRRADGGRGAIRLLDQSVAVSRGDTAVFLVMPKLGKYVTLLALEASGSRDPDAARELSRELEAIQGGQP